MTTPNTLTLKKSPSNSRRREYDATGGSRRIPQKPKQAAWTHEDELHKYIGKEIKVHWNDSEISVATLIQVDKFTLLLKGKDIVVMAFKHAIMGIDLVSE